jgi:hypothetical protein
LYVIILILSPLPCCCCSSMLEEPVDHDLPHVSDMLAFCSKINESTF